MMVTRFEIQIAQDLIRFVNIMNDLIDVVSYEAKEIDAQTGEKLQVREEDGIFRDATLDELKMRAKRTVNNALGYHNLIKNFIDKTDINLIVSGLSALSMDPQVLKNDLAQMKSVCEFIDLNVGKVTRKSNLADLGTYIDNNVPKLILVRRSWVFGVNQNGN